MKFDIEAARKDGHTDAQIAEFLARQNNFDLNAARQAGHKDADLVQFLAAGRPDAPGFVDAWKQGQADMAEGSADFMRRGLLAAFPGASRAFNLVTHGNLDGRNITIEELAARHRAEYEERRRVGGATGMDWGRLLGQAMSPATIVAGASGAPVRAGFGPAAVSGAIGGALSGAFQPADTTTDSMLNAGAGAAGGAVAGAVASKLGDVVRSAWRSVVGNPVSAADIQRAVTAALAEQGVDPATVSNVAMLQMRDQIEWALKNGRSLDSASLVRKSDFESLGVKPTLGQVTRDPMQWARERDMRGIWRVGDKLTDRLQEQRDTLAGKLHPAEIVDDAGVGDRLIESLSGLADRSRKQFGSLYERARQQSGAEAAVDITGLADDFGKILRDYGEDKIPSAVRARLASYGVLDGKQTKLFTLVDAEQAIQQINKLYDPGNRAEAAALNEIRTAIKRAVETSDIGDLFKPARDAAAGWYRTVDRTPALKAVVEDKIAPDDFVRKFVINGKRDDLKALAGALDGDQEAIGAIRSKIIEHLQGAAFGANPARDASFNPSRFKTALDKLAPRIGAFFSPEEITELQTVSRVGGYINSVPNASAPNMSNTAAALSNRAFDVLGGLARIPGARVLAGNVAGRAALNPTVPSAPVLTGPMQQMMGGAASAGAPIATGVPAEPTGRRDPVRNFPGRPLTVSDLMNGI
ncbi:MAG: hypothetical protein M9951_16875 [Burkholderiaceae bacterium]|nr:hypothetical protein [Burkholderiaceae bacterium]